MIAYKDLKARKKKKSKNNLYFCIKWVITTSF